MRRMQVLGKPMRTIRPLTDEGAVEIIDQTALPHAFRLLRLCSLDDALRAIVDMQVRGAPLIGVTAAYGLAMALAERADDAHLHAAHAALAATRPTAVNLHWALRRVYQRVHGLAPAARAAAAWREAAAIAEEDVEQCRRIGEHGLRLLRACCPPARRWRLMTHCNAGWLATVDHGTALAPIYAAFAEGIEVHVWVSETRPRNQGLLTAWELGQQGIAHTLIADNAAGLLLARGEVDAVIVGADRIAANGDVANKIGTYLKALAAAAAQVPFYVAAPRSTIDFSCPDGAAIPLEERSGDELRWLHGRTGADTVGCLRQIDASVPVANPAFDVTPAACVSTLISERGCCPATRAGLLTLYPEEAHV